MGERTRVRLVARENRDENKAGSTPVLTLLSCSHEGSMPKKLTPRESNARLTVKILRRAQGLIAKKNGWTSGADARDRGGEETSIESRTARAFCAGGALVRAASAIDPCFQGAATDALRKSLGVRGEGSVARWNDKPRRTQKQVVAAFEKAIARLERA